MRSLARALFLSAVATAGFAALAAVFAPEDLRQQVRDRLKPSDDGASALDRLLDDELDADNLSDAQALAMLRELARDLDFDEEPV